jgi:hypothetical protein
MPRRSTPALVRVAVVFALSLCTAAAVAEPPPAVAAAPEDKKAEAAARFKKGRALYLEGAWAEALAESLASRQLYPTWSATSVAALSLQKLKRYAEALDMVEAMLREFNETLPASTKQEAQRQLMSLRGSVGTIEIDGAEPGARVVIDGQERGELPALAPLRVTAGSHLVRVNKAGFEPFEARVEVAGGRLAHVQATLHALTKSGRLHVAEQSGKALDVVVDGSTVGKTPWDGLLVIGDHTVLLRGEEDLGAPPVSVTIELDQTATLTLLAEELTASLRIEPVPVNAGVAIDKVTLGHGIWEGRVRQGKHKIEVAAPGFLTAGNEVTLARGERRALRIELDRDPRSAFAPRVTRFSVEVSTAAAFSPLFGGDVASGCSSPCTLIPGIGGYGLVRGGYEPGSGLGFGVTAGYFAATQTILKRSTSVTPIRRFSETVTVDDSLWLRSAVLGAWAGFSLGVSIPIRFRFGAGALLGSVSDIRVGSSEPNTEPPIKPTGEKQNLIGVYIAPEVRVGLAVSRHLEVSVGLEMLAAFVPSPPAWNDEHAVILSRPGGRPDYGTFPSETFAGPILTLAPGLGVRYEF